MRAAPLKGGLARTRILILGSRSNFQTGMPSTTKNVFFAIRLPILSIRGSRISRMVHAACRLIPYLFLLSHFVARVLYNLKVDEP